VTRNLSIQRHFEQQAKTHRPQLGFEGTGKSCWQQWREALLPKVEASLGEFPARVPLNPQVIAQWTEDGLDKQKVVFDVEGGLAVTAYVFCPAGAHAPLPAILCCHGHGPFGKEPVMGYRSTPEIATNINDHNYDYGLQMAQAGFVTMAIDWRGFGERDDRRPPHYHAPQDDRDLCNLHYNRANLFGQTLLGLNLHDARCAMDYLLDQPFVDPDRLGVMGLSFGGTMGTWIAFTDERVKAADIICYSDCFADFAIARNHFCGSQISPGLYALCDVPDLHGLIAPKPLLVEIAVHDQCFGIDSAMRCFQKVKSIYQAADCEDRLVLDMYPGGHAWGGNRSVAFFQEHL